MRFLSRAPVDLQEGSRRNKREDRIVKGRKGRVNDVKSNHIVRNKIEWIVVTWTSVIVDLGEGKV